LAEEFVKNFSNRLESSRAEKVVYLCHSAERRAHLAACCGALFSGVVFQLHREVAMTAYYLARRQLLDLLGKGGGEQTFLPTQTGKLAWLDSAGPEPAVEGLAEPRAVQSAKGFFMPAAESVGRYGSASLTAGGSAKPAGGTEASTAIQAGPVVLVGVRACELRAMRYLDKVMLEGNFDDPAYRARREGITIVACDCVDCTESCFCTLVGGL